MAKVKVTVSEFLPVKTEFLIYDDRGSLLDGCQDVWLRVIPPTFHEDGLRGDLLRTKYTATGAISMTNPRVLQAEEIWLTFGGTNLEVELPKVDRDGQIIYKEMAEGQFEPEMEVVAFPEEGRSAITRQEFLQKLDRLPDYVVQSWHSLVLNTVAKGWAFPF